MPADQNRQSADAPRPLARWDDDESAAPGLLWWAQLDRRYLVEVVSTGAPDTAELRIFDHQRGDQLVVRARVARTTDLTPSPVIADVVAWQRAAIALVDR